MLIISIGATTTRYVTVLKEMNVFYRGNVVVVPKGAIFAQAIPVGGFLQENVLATLRSVEGVKNAVPMIFVLGFDDHESVIQIVPSNITVGIPAGNWSVLTGAITLQPNGGWPSANSELREAVIGPDFSLKYRLSVNSEIEINHKKLKVTGILDAPSSSSFLCTSILMPLTTAQEVYDYPQLISIVVVEPEVGTTEQELADRIDADVQGIGTLTGDERNEVLAPILRDLELWSLGIQTVISGTNTILVMVVSMMMVFERRKELATFDALGVPLTSIVRVVVTETGLIGLLGGLVGIPLGIITALLITYFYTISPLLIILSNVFVLVPPVMMLETLIFTLALSCVAGLLSAVTILRRNTVELLRSDY